jgi:hypothetical protein
VTPNTQAEQTEYPTSPKELVGWQGFAEVGTSCPAHATLIVGPGRALEVSE